MLKMTWKNLQKVSNEAKNAKLIYRARDRITGVLDNGNTSAIQKSMHTHRKTHQSRPFTRKRTGGMFDMDKRLIASVVDERADAGRLKVVEPCSRA